MKTLASIVALATISATAHTLEQTAVGGPAADNVSLGMGVQSHYAAVNAIVQQLATQVTSLSTQVTRLQTCANRQSFYTPGTAGADASGCVGTSIPEKTVAAFNLAACPSGWSAFTSANGRVIVGTGTFDGETYTLREAGGKAAYRLSVDELPPHDHDLRSVGLRMVRKADGDKHGWFQGLKDESAYDSAERPDQRTRKEGRGKPLDNRQPYLALLYCIKN